MMTESLFSGRSIRSFVRRGGRITKQQQHAINNLWPDFGVDFTKEPIDLMHLFGRSADTIIDIGFGNGETLINLAKKYPEKNFLGIEVHEPGIGRCLLQIEKNKILNLKIINHDALEVLRYQIKNQTLSRINILFPDPWPKKRHHKRRLIDKSFVKLANDKLCLAGSIYIATDWENYAYQIDDVMNKISTLKLINRVKHLGDKALDRSSTKFESRGLKKGHYIWDWKFISIKPKS